MRLKEFFAFVTERDNVRIRRWDGAPPGMWTNDPIFQKYRFCNVDREDDTVTQWIAKNVRIYANRGDDDAWFKLCVARLFNWPPTLKRLGLGRPGFPLEKWRATLDDMDSKGEKIFTGAYIVSTNGVRKGKYDYILEDVLAPLWGDLKSAPWRGATCHTWASWLMEHNGFAEFMANQIVTDMKYTPILCDASDVDTFVLPGPGTLRGLNRLMGCGIKESMSNVEAQQLLLDVRDRAPDRFVRTFQDLNNVSNCFCEWDKYERVRLGEGKPRATYKLQAWTGW